MREFDTPEMVRVDAYQAGHFEMIPPGMSDFECSHVTARKRLHYGGDERADNRLVMAGVMPWIMLELLSRRMTAEDIDLSRGFYDDFHASVTPPSYRCRYPFPEEMFERIVNEFDGKWPICVMTIQDGQAFYVGEPLTQIWTDVPGMGEAVGWIESGMLPYIWASIAVATRGRVRKEQMLRVFQKAFPSKSEAELLQMIGPKFHDFGRRGATASQITGIAHLMNWLGTDTVDAAYAAVNHLNGGKKFGACSIFAAAHRTVTPWSSESEAYDHMIKMCGHGIFAVVADSYGFSQGIRKLASKCEVIRRKGGFLVGRPDSGSPVHCVLEGLRVFADAFGSTRQEVGLKVITGAGIIQGDGVSDRLLFEEIYPAMIAAGFCPSNLAIGMGEYNHRAVRSDIELGLKTCCVGVADDFGEPVITHRDVMKSSDTDWKRSIPGPVSLPNRGAGNFSDRVCPISVEDLKRGRTGRFVVAYDGRPNPLPVTSWSFDDTRRRTWETWNDLPPVVGDTFHPDLRRKQEQYLEEIAAAAAK